MRAYLTGILTLTAWAFLGWIIPLMVPYVDPPGGPPASVILTIILPCCGAFSVGKSWFNAPVFLIYGGTCGILTSFYLIALMRSARSGAEASAGMIIFGAMLAIACNWLGKTANRQSQLDA